MVHRILGLAHGAPFEREIIVTDFAVSHTGEVEAKHHKPHRRQASCYFHVKTLRADPMDDPRVQKDHSGTARGCRSLGRVGQDYHLGLGGAEKQSGFLECWTLEIKATKE